MGGMVGLRKGFASLARQGVLGMSRGFIPQTCPDGQRHGFHAMLYIIQQTEQIPRWGQKVLLLATIPVPQIVSELLWLHVHRWAESQGLHKSTGSTKEKLKLLVVERSAEPRVFPRVRD